MISFSGQAEFHQRLERFKSPDFRASTARTTGPATTPQMTRSDFVSAIQQKLHSTPAPSSKQASRIHQVGLGPFVCRNALTPF